VSAPLALVTGATGQDGAYLCRALLADGWRVCGTRRTGVEAVPWRFAELGIAAHPALELRAVDVTDTAVCADLVAALQPAQVFHLAAVSSVAAAYEAPLAALAASGTACANLLDAIRRHAPAAHLVYASSAELFDAPLVDESTPPRARSPYAFAKLVGHHAVAAFRDAYGVRASAAILFNHESPLRGAGFVTRKIAAAAARAARGADEVLALGNLDAQRDFGYAPDYVAAMRTMAARDTPADYVLATGVATTIRAFADAVYAAAGIALAWSGAGVDAVAHDAAGRLRVRVDPAFLRPLDAAVQRGDASRARRELGFAPSLTVTDLARTMLDAELRRLAP
jgi:GDPmannose 4,6-dehydratase